MRTVLLASLRTHTRRYVAAVVAVVIGVSFVVVTGAITSAARSGLTAGAGLPYRHADAVVSGLDGATADTLVQRARAAGDSAAVLGFVREPVTGTSYAGERVDVGAVADTAALRWQTLEKGRFPTGPGQAVVDANAARTTGVAVGDRLRVGSGASAVDVTVSGLVDSPSSSVGAALYLPWDDVARWQSELYVDSVAYDASGSLPDLAAQLPAGAQVSDPTVFVQHRAQQLNHGVDIIAIALLVFAAVALVTSVLVIANTFSILFAQRSRDLALLRCVGATRAQVRRAIRAEALVLGVASAALGLVVGSLLGLGLVGLTRSLWPSSHLGSASLPPVWLVVAFVVGVGATLVAAWLPTRAATRVTPLAALRPTDDAVTLRTGAGRLRVGSGLAMVGVGVVLLAVSVAAASAPVMVAGGGLSFLGLLLLGPVVVPGMVRLSGVVVGRLLGAPGRLAAGNAVRQPRRTAATASSLLVGVTLTTAVLTGLASSRSAVDHLMDGDHPLDLTVTATGAGLPPGLLDDVRGTDGVERAVAVPGIAATTTSGTAVEVIAPEADAASVVRSDAPLPQPGRVLLPADLGDQIGADGTVTLTVSGRPVTLPASTGGGWGEAAVVAPDLLRSLSATPDTGAIWLRADGGADAEDLGGRIGALARPADADLTNALSDRAYVDLQLDVFTGAVVALLGIAVVIALVGIANTLGLSVLERAREHALLRALGLTRRGLRQTLAVEALLLSAAATVVGTLVGVIFAWVAVHALVRPVVPQTPMVLPWGQLALIVVVAGAAGLAAGVLPARRAARVAPAAGLSLE